MEKETKEIKQKIQKRMNELKLSLTQIDNEINQALNQCPFITKLRNMKTSLEGGILELEGQVDLPKKEEK